MPPDATPTELELKISTGEGINWLVETRATRPKSDAVRGISGKNAVSIDLNLQHLLELDGDAYQRYLTDALFGPVGELNDIGRFVVEERNAGDAGGNPLRLRLLVGPGQAAARLHGVIWERLLAPDDREMPLLTQPRIHFSRFVDSVDARKVALRSWGRLRAVAMVAGWPDEVSEGGRRFAAIDVDAEIDRATAAIGGGIDVVEVGRHGTATEEALLEAMGPGCDVLYLYCHGFFHDGQPKLVFQDGRGEPRLVDADKLVQRMGHQLSALPRLAVLVSCHSAGTANEADQRTMAAIGPRLGELGVAAVIAMQGEVSQATLGTFVETFFGSFVEDVAVDAATADARRSVADDHPDDWWMPALFTRLRSGRVGYNSGWVGNDTSHWESLVSKIDLKQVLPIIGPRLLAPYIGTRRDLAKAWSQDFEYPLEPPFDEDLPQVAQYLANVHGADFPRLELRKFIGLHLLRKHGAELKDADLPEELQGLDPNEPEGERLIRRRLVQQVDLLDQLIVAAGRARRAAAPQREAHAVLARMRLPVYVTTQASSLLEDALAAEGARPVREYYRWRDLDVDWNRDVDDPFDTAHDHEAPLVYHLFGHTRKRNSVVLTEDDYFEFLYEAGGTRKEEVPEPVIGGITGHSLLIIGFGIHEWPFRVLFKLIHRLKDNAVPRRGHKDFAVQIDPEESTTRDVENFRALLTEQLGGEFKIYWGSAQEFLSDLSEQL